MSKSEKKIFAVEIILCIFFLADIFLKNTLYNHLIIIVLLITALLIYLIAGYEKDSNINGEEKSKLLEYVFFYCLGFIVLNYGLGLFTGYVKTPYKKGIFDILQNAFFPFLIILMSELLRYMIVKKGEKSKPILVFVILIFILIDLALNVRYYDFNVLSDLLEFSTIVFLPSFFKNIILTTFTYKYGMKPSIIYRLVLELYIYIIPITPDLGLYLESVILMIFPILLNAIINYGFEKKDKNEDKKKKDNKKTVNKKYMSFTKIIVFVLVVLMILLNSNLFRFWVASVGSGSMEPTINVGDLIVVDKAYKNNLDKLDVGDILVFKIDENIYTHRITKINKDNDKYSFNTKGDRKGQMEDSWIVTDQDVIGVVKFRIKYLGYPTVWLSRFLEVNDG